jgi:adenylyl-sulfate kinase
MHWLKSKTFWLTGLSGSGKTTLANELYRKFGEINERCTVLDGDNIRSGLCRDLGFAKIDRSENIRRVAEVARLMNDAGVIVIVALISPFRKDRDNARMIIGQNKFIEIYLSTCLDVCENRDPKGLYKKARNGLIDEFTGITSPYEIPINQQVTIDTSIMTIDECINMIFHN